MGRKIMAREINKIGIVGSGQIGPDIALHFLIELGAYDVEVVVVDVVLDALDAGLHKLKGKIGKLVDKGRMRSDKAEDLLNKITFTLDYEALAGSALVIEAASERLELKQQIVAKLEALCSDDTILASNSSHLEPDLIFAKAAHPERTAIIHYFFPAERNPLVEIATGEKTCPEIARFLMRFYEYLNKIPIQVKGRYGYSIDPVFEGLFQASALIVESGLCDLKQLDAIACKALGLGVGPYTAMNLTGGMPITHHGLDQMHDKIMPYFKAPQSLNAQLESRKPWEIAGRGEEVTYSDKVYRRVADTLMGAYFGIVCEIIDAGVATIADMELGISTGLVMKPPFMMMNRLGVEKALELVKAYAAAQAGFKVAGVLEKQAASAEPWKIPVVLREDVGNIAVVRIRRPRVLNALNSEVVKQLDEIFEGIKADTAIVGAVLTGFGTRAFVAGADINELARIETPEAGAQFALRGQAVLNRIENMGKPVICAMNGLGFGGGNEIAMACHARLAAKGQRFFVGQPEPKLGIIPGYGGTQRLPRWIGMEKAWPLIRNGNPISSAQALELGLIRAEYPIDVLLDRAMDLAGQAASGTITIPSIPTDPIPCPDELPAVDIGHLSRKIDEILVKATVGGAKMTLAKGLEHEARTFGECLLTRDMRIGMDNFIKNGPKVNAEFIHE